MAKKDNTIKAARIQRAPEGGGWMITAHIGGVPHRLLEVVQGFDTAKDTAKRIAVAGKVTQRKLWKPLT